MKTKLPRKKRKLIITLVGFKGISLKFQVLLDLRSPVSGLLQFKHILFFKKRKLATFLKGLPPAQISYLVQGTIFSPSNLEQKKAF